MHLIRTLANLGPMSECAVCIGRILRGASNSGIFYAASDDAQNYNTLIKTASINL